MKDDLGDRMKGYEEIETKKTLDKSKPIYARLDGRNFSKFTRNLSKPFDSNLSTAMVETTKYLVKETNAKIGYTQSDEISLIWKVEPEQEMMFNGKIQKLNSILASLTTAKFMSEITTQEQSKLPHFDCRLLNLPNEDEAANMLLWRSLDARKNAINSLARKYFSHKELQNRSQTEMKDLLKTKHIDIETYPKAFRYGTYIQKREIEIDPRDLTLPSHITIDTPVIRSTYQPLEMPPFIDVMNRTDVIFRQSPPQVRAVMTDSVTE